MTNSAGSQEQPEWLLKPEAPGQERLGRYIVKRVYGRATC